jgi:ATP-dependent RNA helicase DeaD
MVMKSFRNRQIQMLVATDVAARGIDVDDITHVINYQLPDEPEIYTHRSGRTGRAGKTGISMVIVSKSELRKIKSIERIIKKKFEQKEIPDGMKICEVQLFHLANDIKNTTINHDIDPYLPSIEEVLEGLTKEEIIKKVFSVEFTRFFNHYKNASDLNSKVSNSRDRDGASGGSYGGDSTRYFINVGTKDDFDWMSLKDYLKETLDLGRDDVSRVDVKESFSFFNTSTEMAEKVIATFENVQHQGRSVNVEVSQDTGRGGGRRSSGGGDRNRSRGKSSGDFKSRRSDSSSESRGRRSDKPSEGSSRRRSGDSGNSSESSGRSGSRKKNISSSVNRRKSNRS